MENNKLRLIKVIKVIKVLLLFVFSLLFTLNAFANEADNVNYYCSQIKGNIEYRLADKTRVDCLTEITAYEFDFAKKFYEAIGQSLYYSIKTNRNAGIYLIVQDFNDFKYINRAIVVCSKYNIELIVVEDIVKDIAEDVKKE